MSMDIYERDIRGNLLVSLCNTEMNRSALQGMPHTEISDLSAVYYYRNQRTGEPELITNNFLQEHDITDIPTALIHADARITSHLLSPAVVTSMRSLLGQPETLEEGEVPMYVVTNYTATRGAAAILYPGVLDGLAGQFNDDLVCIPSSIHEMIIVPAGLMQDRQDVEDMIYGINRSMLQDSDFLSDHAYIYDAKEKLFERWDQREERLAAMEQEERPSLLGKLNEKKELLAEHGQATATSPQKNMTKKAEL